MVSLNIATPASSTRPFRVIIAGGGIGGLAMSHALQKAKIDHIVLEKGEVAPPWGASISFWANGVRILQQLGCLELLEKNCTPLKRMYGRARDGKAFLTGDIFSMLVERNGYDAITFERRRLLELLYEALPDKSKILTGKRVKDAVETDAGICVELTDGTFEEGDILIGCDGVHSTVRELMWKNANQAIPNLITAQEKTSRVTTYNCLIGVAKNIGGLGANDMTWVHNTGLSFLFLTQPDHIYFFVHFKLSKQIRWPSRPKWNDEDAEKAAASVAEHPVSDSLVFGEVWKNRIRGHLIALEEGVFDHWHFGRIALAGDSVHKVTPNLALGGNAALESIVVLTNEINSLVKSQPAGQRPTRAAISKIFQRYQEQRKPRMAKTFDASASLTRLHAYDGLINYIIMRWVVPLQGVKPMADQLAELCAGAPKFDFIPLKKQRSGTIKWKDDDPVLESGKAAPINIKGAAPMLAGVFFLISLMMVFVF